MTEPQGTPPPGWYQHPTMVGTQGYWDGAKWSGAVAPAEKARGVTPTTLTQIKWAVAITFLIPVFFLSAMPSSVGTESCGTWMAPRFDDLEVSLLKLDSALEGGTIFDEARIDAVAKECGSKLDTRKMLVLLLAGIGAGVRFGALRLIPVAYPPRRTPAPPGPKGWRRLLPRVWWDWLVIGLLGALTFVLIIGLVVSATG